MKIDRIKIINFKCFKELNLPLNEGLNILVGKNEAGKSTILEAIHLALTGIFNGRYIKNELTQYLFNIDVVLEYFKDVAADRKPVSPPSVLIELYFKTDDFAEFDGKNNTEKCDSSGLSFRIAFDEGYKEEYEHLVRGGGIKSLPVEYYNIFWRSFAGKDITAISIPIKPAFIDSSTNRYQNGSDIYISRIVRDTLEPKEIVEISQAHRTMRDSFMNCPTIKVINEKIRSGAKISDKKIELSVELLSKNAWENSLMTYLDNVPFHFIGKGEQSTVKTKLALGHKKAKKASLLLLEEPENHLTHAKLNRLIGDIKAEQKDRQIIISTHNSFVANKLGLDNLILLNDGKPTCFRNLTPDTESFFEKIAGYDTLRLVLCKKAILVEGDSDELIVQKAYQIKHEKLPIEDEIDVISVGTSFLRFLEIAEKIGKPVAVVTDNDGDVEGLKTKYENYLGPKAKDFIIICFNDFVDNGMPQISGKPFNRNTLEPEMLKANGLEAMNHLLDKAYTSEDDLLRYMRANKTECALKIFKSTGTVSFPQYIVNAIEWVSVN